MPRRADFGSGSFARPDQKMGNMRGAPTFGQKWRASDRITSNGRKALKKIMSAKRRRHDRGLS